MLRTVLCGLSIPAFLALTGALSGCGKGDPAPESLTIAPDPANVATCSSKVFTAQPADGATFSLEGKGTLKDGTYTAPLSVPEPATATIKATRDGATASATVTLATAFPEAAIDTGRAPQTGTPDHVHAVAARGKRVFALLEGTSSLAVVRSDDGGLTWGKPVALPGGEHVASIAMDAGDDNTVYATVHGKDQMAGSTLDLVVSTDGGATFAAHRLFEGGNGEAQDADVASPAPGTVMIAAPATWQDGNGGQGATLLVWRDTQKGSTLPPLSSLDNGYDGKWSPGVEHRLKSGRLIETNDGRGGPQLATNGNGKVCLVSSDYGIDGADEHHDVACSSDGGATLGAFVPAISGKPADLARARVAVSADGKLVVVAYNAFQDASLDSIGSTRYVVSSDSGATFGAPHTHPDVLGADSLKKAVSDAEVHIDAQGVIWFARNVDGGALQLDKSCDQGETLSGAFALPIAGNHGNGFFFESSAGLFAGGVRLGASDAGLSVTRLLAP